MIQHSDRRRDVPRKEAMLARRIRQRTRKPGFTPVPNAKIDARIKATAGLLTISYKAREEKSGVAMPSGAVIQEEAIRAVARTLPPELVGRQNRRHNGALVTNCD